MSKNTNDTLLTIISIVGFASVAPAVLLMAPAIAVQLAEQLRLGPISVGYLFTAELGGMSLATIPAYYWLSRYNWRNVSLFFGLVFIIVNIISMFVLSYNALLIMRFFSSLCGGSLIVMCISAATLTSNPTRVYGLWVMGQLLLGSIGLVILPVLFVSYGIAACYFMLVILMSICCLFIKFLPERNIQFQKNISLKQKNENFVKGIIGLVAVLVFYISLSGVWTFVGSVAEKSQISTQTSGNILSIASIMGVLGALSATIISARSNRYLLLIVSYIIMIIGIVLLLGVPSTIRYAFATFLFKYAWTFILPFLLATLVDLDSTGFFMNTINLVIGGGLAIGPAIAGQLIERNGGSLQLMLVLSSVAALASLGLILKAQKSVMV